MGAHHSGHRRHGWLDAGRKRRLALALALTAAYMGAEVVGGLLANSLALLADAAHMLSDAAALSLALFAMWMARRPAPARRTFGYYRIEILAALVNGAVLLAIAGAIIYAAIGRLAAPPEVRGSLMLAVAVGGLVVNLVGVALLRGGAAHSLNVRGAYLHMLADALGSVGAIVGALLIAGFGWQWADPAASILISLLVLVSAVNLLREAVAVLMESAPGHIDVDQVRDAIVSVEGVIEVHDLHVWTITSGMEALSGHVVTGDGAPHTALLETLRRTLHDRFGIDHITIQIEPPDFDERGCC